MDVPQEARFFRPREREARLKAALWLVPLPVGVVFAFVLASPRSRSTAARPIWYPHAPSPPQEDCARSTAGRLSIGCPYPMSPWAWPTDAVSVSLRPRHNHRSDGRRGTFGGRGK